MNFFEEMSASMQNIYFFAPFFFIIGACFASFFNVVALRFPMIMESEEASQVSQWLKEHKFTVPDGLDNLIKKISLSFPASHCYTCHNTLKWYHNIPILSYIFLRGKCGYCSTPFSAQYAVIEFMGAIISTLVYVLLFPKLSLAQFWVAYAFFIISYLLIIIDFKTMLLPDEYNYILLWGGLLATSLGVNFYQNDLVDSVWGIISIYTLTFSIAFVVSKYKGIEAMGGGDLKLLAAMGAIFGIKGAMFALFFSPAFGIIFWLYGRVKNPENPEFPYGPAIILSSWIYIFYGTEILKFFFPT